MNAKEELLKITIGKITTGVLLLIGFLCAVIWRESLFQKWTQVAEGVSKPALMALLGLVLIAAVLEAFGIAYLLYLLYRRPAVAPAEPPMLKRFGVLWDKDESPNPHCPADETLLHLSGRVEGTPRHGAYDIMQCPKCNVEIPLYGDHGHQTLFSAKTTIRNLRDRGLISD